MAERIYIGFARRGWQTLPDRTIPFERGVPVEVTDDEAAVLDEAGGWITPKKKPAPTPKNTEGSEPEPKEP